jgi:hypothetical protein
MLYLASQLPRRAELLARLGPAFEPLDLEVPEVRAPDEPRRSTSAACPPTRPGPGWRNRPHPQAVVLGSDTEVVLDGEVFGKPADAADAAAMLRRLAGRTHQVMTVVAVAGGRATAQVESRSEVTFAPMAEADIAPTSPPASRWARPVPTPSRAGRALRRASVRQLLRRDGGLADARNLDPAARIQGGSDGRGNPGQCHPRETRVAVVETACCRNCTSSAAGGRGVVGNIYKGKVQRVMPGMQAAFVEVGLERAAFLHANDVVRPPPRWPADTGKPPCRRLPAADRRAAARRPGSWCRWSRTRSAPRARA